MCDDVFFRALDEKKAGDDMMASVHPTGMVCSLPSSEQAAVRTDSLY